MERRAAPTASRRRAGQGRGEQGIRGQRGKGAGAEGRDAQQVRVQCGGGRGGAAGQVRGQGRVQAGRGRVREGRGETRVWKRSIPLDAALDSRAARRCRIPPVPARLMTTDFSPKSSSATHYLITRPAPFAGRPLRRSRRPSAELASALARGNRPRVLDAKFWIRFRISE